MVTRSLAFVLCYVALALGARAELRLTPRALEYELDGVKFTQFAFSDGGATQITYSPPKDWQVSGSAQKLSLRPPQTPQAEGSVTVVPLAVPGAFDAETTKRLTQELIASVPAGSTDVAVVSQEMSPVLIGQKETFLAIVSYTFYGEKFARSTLFLNRGTEQVRFQFVSRASEFKKLQSAFLASHFSWQNL